MMENPLELPVPDNPIKRVHELARDLAWCATNGEWDSRISIAVSGELHQFVTKKLDVKWKNQYPSIYLLVSFAYLAPIEEKNFVHPGPQYPMKHNTYIITSKAFALLEQPLTPPSVFISHKQDQSSALGLLVEARLKLADPAINVFIDKLLDPGDDWEDRLKETIFASDNFICLIGEDTLQSATIQKEIAWAFDAGCYIIPIWHYRYEFDKDSNYPDRLRRIQAIKILSENAKGYESAISDLLIKLGYSTL